MADFQDLTPEDFGSPSVPKEGVAPGAPKELTAKEIEPSALKRGLAGAGRSMVNKWRGLTGETEPAPGAELEEDTAGSIGAMIPDALGSMLMPARIIPQAIYGVATKAVEPASNALERVVSGLKGGAEFGGGQALASGAVRGINALGGRLSRTGEAAKAAKGAGLNLTAGDLADSRLMRLAEEKSIHSPSRNQADEIANIMNTEGGDPITLGVMNAYKAAQDKVTGAAGRLDQMIQSGVLPGVTPRKTYEMVKEIARRSPDTLNNVRDPELRTIIDEIISYPAGRIPKTMDFGKLDELRKALGPVMAKVEVQSKSGASNITTSDANRWKQLYKGIMNDIDSWGSKAATEDALKAHKELSSTFKNEVLPMREHPIAGKIINERYDRPEDLVRDLTSPRNRSIVNDLYGRLDMGGKNAFDAIRAANRGTKEFVRGEGAALTFPEKAALYGAGLTSPAWAPMAAGAAPWLAGGLIGEQALVHGLNTPVGKALIAGSPTAAKNPLANAALYSGLRTAVPRAPLAILKGERD